MKKLIALIIVVCLAFAFAAGCGSVESTGDAHPPRQRRLLYRRLLPSKLRRWTMTRCALSMPTMKSSLR